jgi:hypothetical protein
MRVHDVLEQLLAIQRDDRNAVPVAALEDRVEGHVHVLDLDLMPGHGPPKRVARLVAQMAAGLAVEGEYGHPATLDAWNTWNS